MNYGEAIGRVVELAAENEQLRARLEQREAHDKMTECGCGDIRPAAELCHICGKCQMGCCLCGEELGRLRKHTSEQSSMLDEAFKELLDTKATYEPEIDRLKAQLAANAALLEEARTTIEDLRVALKWTYVGRGKPAPLTEDPYGDVYGVGGIDE